MAWSHFDGWRDYMTTKCWKKITKIKKYKVRTLEKMQKIYREESSHGIVDSF